MDDVKGLSLGRRVVIAGSSRSWKWKWQDDSHWVFLKKMKQKLELKCDKHFILPKLKVKLKIRGFLWRYSEMLISTGSSWRRSWRCCWRWCWWGRPSSGWRSAGWWSFSSSGDLFSLFLIGQTMKRTIYVTSEKWHKLTSKWGLLTICCSVVEMGNCLTQRGQNINFGQIVWETQNFFVRRKRKCQKYPIHIISRTKGNLIWLN